MFFNIRLLNLFQIGLKIMENTVRITENFEPGRLRIDDAKIESREALLAEILRLRAYVKELELAAESDSLAPVFNRRAFLRELVKAQSVFQRHAIPTTLILLDLDGFKNINVRYGQVMGDELIFKVGQELQTNVRDCDLVARLGSDDFAVLLFKCEAEHARSVAEKLTRSLGSISIDMPSNSLHLSASWGMAPVINGMTPERILSIAGEQLARRKRQKIKI